MAVSEALHAGSGFTVEVSEDGVAYTTIAEIVDAEPPSWLVKEAKATHNTSPDQMTESKPGLGDTSNGMLTINYTDTQLNVILALYRLIRYWRFSFPIDTGQTVPARYVMLGFWTKLSPPKLDPDDTNVMISTIELKRSSNKPTHTAGS